MDYTYKVEFKSIVTVEFFDEDEEPTDDDINYEAWDKFDIDCVDITSIERVD